MKRLLAAALALALLAAIFAIGACAAEDIVITNPYENVDWSEYTPRRAQLHTHTTASDGKQTMAEALESYYGAGYDFVAVTDHGLMDRGWAKPNYRPVFKAFWNLFSKKKIHIQGLSEERLREMTEGVGRDGRGMLRVPFGIEHNHPTKKMHLNSWFVDWGNVIPGGDRDYAAVVRNIDRKGGLVQINHPSDTRYIRELDDGAWSIDDYYIKKIQRLLEKYPALLGIELKAETDRVLWDMLLSNLAPTGRNVFGTATSDSHNWDSVDTRWVWALMPEPTVENLRECLETGAFLSAVRIDDREQPMITNIAVQGDTITITAEHHSEIRWVSNGEVIAAGETLSLTENKAKLGAYVRAEIAGEGGTLCTQPFLLSYEGMPEGSPVPRKFIDYDGFFGSLRMILYPFIWVMDAIWAQRWK
ncbi:MAG: hypothetical protein FWC27_10615 [Firmicutes bacterium]|nr:hypothetical protein [Bacillota bacterium]